jgi:hypothetical protein
MMFANHAHNTQHAHIYAYNIYAHELSTREHYMSIHYVIIYVYIRMPTRIVIIGVRYNIKYCSVLPCSAAAVDELSQR